MARTRIRLLGPAVLAAAALAGCGPETQVLQVRGGPIGHIPNQVVTHPDTDIPCAGDPPAECASPVPTPDGADRSLGRPLDVPSLDVTLDHVGPYAIEVGTAILPNGYLSVLTLRLENGADGTYDSDGVGIQLRSTPTGSPQPMNRYERGVATGPQTVHVFLVFNLRSAAPGAVMRVRDLAVG